MHDLLGLYDRFTPKFVKQFARLGEVSIQALMEFKKEVENRSFPATEHSFTMKEAEIAKLLKKE